MSWKSTRRLLVPVPYPTDASNWPPTPPVRGSIQYVSPIDVQFGHAFIAASLANVLGSNTSTADVLVTVTVGSGEVTAALLIVAPIVSAVPALPALNVAGALPFPFPLLGPLWPVPLP